VARGPGAKRNFPEDTTATSERNFQSSDASSIHHFYTDVSLL
jgi:hypothetical protein